MDSVMLHRSLDQQISPYKSHTRNYPQKIHHHRHQPFISRPNETFLPSHFNTIGLIQSPPPFFYHHHPQPPLLPLPATVPRRIATTSSLPVTKKQRKSKSPKKEQKINHSPKKCVVNVSSDVTNVLPCFSSGNVYSNASKGSNYNTNSLSSVRVVESDQVVDIYSGSVVGATSPPPSSLPLPSFSMRPKMLSCKIEVAAAGMDTGAATDNLRRLLRLQ